MKSVEKKRIVKIVAIRAVVILLITIVLIYTFKKDNSSKDTVEKFEEKTTEMLVVEDNVQSTEDKPLPNISDARELEEIVPSNREDYLEQSVDAKTLPEFTEYVNNVLPESFRENIVLEDFSVFQDFVQYTYNVQSTDGIFILEQHHGNGLSFLEFVNRYNSEYPVILFSNGIPSNVEYIYTRCAEEGIYGNFTTTYSDGDTQVELLDANTGTLETVLQL